MPFTDEDLKRKIKEDQILKILHFSCLNLEYLEIILNELKLEYEIDRSKSSEINLKDLLENVRIRSIKERLELEEFNRIMDLAEKLKEKELEIYLRSQKSYFYSKNSNTERSIFSGGFTGNEFWGIFTPFIEIAKNLLDPKEGGFLHSIMTFFNKVRVFFNPATSLTAEEVGKSKHSDLFVKAAEYNKDFNKLYRELLNDGVSEQQMLYRFIKNINDKSMIEDAKDKHKLFKAAENKLLSYIFGKDVNNFMNKETAEFFAEKINRNLTKVSSFTFRAYEDVEGHDVPYERQIDSVVAIVKDLVTKIQDQQRQLKESCKDQNISKEQKLAMYKFIEENKIKLYRFFLKTESWTNMQTLSKDQEFNYTYIESQFKKFPDSEQRFTLEEIPGDNMYIQPSYEFAAKEPNKGILRLFKLNESMLANQKEFDDRMEKEKASYSRAKATAPA